MMVDWSRVEALKPPKLTQLFADDPNRVAGFTVDVAGIHFDFSKTHLDAEGLAAFQALAKSTGLVAKRDALFAGDPVNTSEGRAVTHVAERGEGSEDDSARAAMLHARMRALIDAIEGDALGPVRHILHIGIGGSALGPDLLVDALGRDADRYDVAVVGNLDRVAQEEVFGP